MPPWCWWWLTSAPVQSLCPVAGGDGNTWSGLACASSAVRAAWGTARLFPAHAMPEWAGAVRCQQCRHRLLHRVYHYPLLTHCRPSFHPHVRHPGSSCPCLPRGEPGAKGPSRPWACGERAWESHAGATSPFLWDWALPGSITVAKPAAIIWKEQGEIPQVLRDSLGISLPLLEHHQASAKSQTDGAECLGGATAGTCLQDPSGQWLHPVAPRALCQDAVGRRPVFALALCLGALGQLPLQSLTQ